MVKKQKLINRFLENQENFEAESLYIASGLKAYQVCSDDPRMTFDLLTARSNMHLHTDFLKNYFLKMC